MECISDVEIEGDGVFKYILLELSEKACDNKKRTKLIVRGYEWAEFHGNIESIRSKFAYF